MPGPKYLPISGISKFYNNIVSKSSSSAQKLFSEALKRRMNFDYMGMQLPSHVRASDFRDIVELESLKDFPFMYQDSNGFYRFMPGNIIEKANISKGILDGRINIDSPQISRAVTLDEAANGWIPRANTSIWMGSEGPWSVVSPYLRTRTIGIPDLEDVFSVGKNGGRYKNDIPNALSAFFNQRYSQAEAAYNSGNYEKAADLIADLYKVPEADDPHLLDRMSQVQWIGDVPKDRLYSDKLLLYLPKNEGAKVFEKTYKGVSKKPVALWDSMGAPIDFGASSSGSEILRMYRNGIGADGQISIPGGLIDFSPKRYSLFPGDSSKFWTTSKGDRIYGKTVLGYFLKPGVKTAEAPAMPMWILRTNQNSVPFNEFKDRAIEFGQLSPDFNSGAISTNTHAKEAFELNPTLDVLWGPVNDNHGLKTREGLFPNLFRVRDPRKSLVDVSESVPWDKKGGKINRFKSKLHK